MFHQRFLEAPYEDDGADDYLADKFEEWCEDFALVEGDSYEVGSVFCSEVEVFRVTAYSLDEDNDLVVDKEPLESEELVKLVIKAYS